nr:MAG TPA: hypothetical protein [Caudoviricetes sp.]
MIFIKRFVIVKLLRTVELYRASDELDFEETR